MNGSGKGVAVDHLSRRGFRAFSLSDVIRDELAARGVAETREAMIELGRELREQGGVDALARRAAAQLEPGADYVIDSIRHPAEVAALGECGDSFTLVWIQASPAVRLARMRARGRPGDPQTIERLSELEARETDSTNAAGQQLHAVRDLADVVLENEGSLDDFCSMVDAALERLQPLGGRS